MKYRLLTIALTITIVTACRNETRQTTTDPGSATATPAQATQSAAPATAPYDLQFIDTMSKHHKDAIEMATMAEAKVQLPQLKDLVKKIPVDQQKEIDQMKAWRDQWYPGAAPAENMQMPGMSSSMNMSMGQMDSMKPGKEYDAMFIDMMTPHHESAVQMAHDALGKAEHQEVKTIAQQIIDAQTKEIAAMKVWKAKLAK